MAVNCNSTTPCFDRMKESFVSGMSTMEAVAITLGVIELFCLLTAVLFNFFWKKEETTRELELMDEARRLNLAEKAQKNKKGFNFDNPFDDEDE